MSHEVSINNGVAECVFGSNKAAWHGLGKVVSGLMTANEALAMANLAWKVKACPVQVISPDGTIQTLPFPNGETLDTFQGICREDTGACLGVMKGRYTPIQNSECFDFFDALIGQGKAVYDTAGALRGGKQVWLLAKVDGTIKINGDDHHQYALMLTSHDGSYALQVSWVLIRVVCANTLSIALRGATNVCKVRHTSNWKDKEAEAARILGLGEHYFKTVQDALAGMNDKLLTPEQMAEFSRVLIPAKDEKDVPTRTQNIRDELNRLFQRGDGNKGASRWDALQAVTDYADHGQTLRGENSTRLESSLMGSGAQLKQKAYDILTSEDAMSELMARAHKVSESNAVNSGDFNRLIGM